MKTTFNISHEQLYNLYIPLHSALNGYAAALKKADDRFLDSSKSVISRVIQIAEKAFVSIGHLAHIAFKAITSTFFIWSNLGNIKNWEKLGCDKDISLLTEDQQVAARGRIEADVEKLMPEDSKEAKNAAINQILTYYARGYKIYGPMVRLWVEHLFEKANKENKSIVFMARDGIAPFHVAHELINKPEFRSKYPNLTPERLSLVYLSRNVMAWASKACEENKKIATRYLNQEIPNTTNPEGLLFVDIGFMGSMIDKIRDLMSKSHHAGKSCDFEYLISHTKKASGFLGDLKDPLKDIESAGLNPAVHWLEDSHQGIQKSPKTLIEFEGRIVPDTIAGREECTKDPLQKLLRKFASMGCEEGASELVLAANEHDRFNEKKSYMIRFEDTLRKIKNLELPIFIEHS